MRDNILEASDIIEKITKQHKITCKDLSIVMGLSTIHISRIYNGNNNVSRHVLAFLRILNRHPQIIIKWRATNKIKEY